MTAKGHHFPTLLHVLAGFALVLASCPAVAMGAESRPNPAPAINLPSPDGLQPGELYLEADLVVRNDQTKITTATGNVEARYDGRTIRANELVYDEVNSIIRAHGKVQLINSDKTVEFSEDLVLDSKQNIGAARQFALQGQDSIKLAANSVVRRSELLNELNQAIYTPCDICAADGKSKTPSWSIQADKIVQDHEHQLVYYRNAVVKIHGLPVLFMPIFWHPDPQAVRKSGFLTPNVGSSRRRGISAQLPYVQVLNKSSDITITPQINSKVNPFVNVKYRQRFQTGALEARGGMTYDYDFDGAGNAFGTRTARSYILASGAFAINEAWRWGFTAERTSDKVIFDKYEIGEVYVPRGPFVPDDRRLISQVYATRQDAQSWLSVGAFAIQGLRPGDNDRTFPMVGPLVESRWDLGQPVLGGRIRLQASAVALTRDQALGTTANVAGLDSRRATLSGDWNRVFTSDTGLRLTPFAFARFDAYSLGDLNGVAGSQDSQGRAIVTVGTDLSLPLAKRLSNALMVVEPIAQVMASPKIAQIRAGTTRSGDPIYLNEDSTIFQFDESNLFRNNRFPGYDLVEDGVRANAGVRTSFLWDDGRRANLLVGRSYRAASNSIFSTTSGLSKKASDWIVAADAQPIKGLSVFTRSRLDSDNLTIQRAEAGANLYTRSGSGFFRYLLERSYGDTSRKENIDLGGEVFVTKHLGLTAYGNRDLAQNAWVIRDMGLVYRDECTRVDVIYRREDTVVGRLGKTDSVSIRLTLATLGGPLYAN